MKKAYLAEKRKADDPDEEIIVLPPKKRGRQFLLGEQLDKQIQEYLKIIRGQGGIVNASVVISAAKGIIMATDSSLLMEYGGHINLSRHWAYHVLDRMKFTRRKATTSKSKTLPQEFAKIKIDFLKEIAAVITIEEIPPELILNWDQTGIHLVPAAAWTMDQIGSKRVEISGVNDKRQVTAVFCGSMLGEFLPLQVIYQGKTDRCHPQFKFPGDWDICHSPKHWSTETTMIRYIEEILLPYIEGKRDSLGDLPSLVIIDNFKGQTTPAINQLLEKNNVHVVYIPPNCTDKLQPMDVAVNKPAKDYLKRRFEDWYAGEVMKQVQNQPENASDESSIAELTPIDLSFTRMKELSAHWLLDMAEYLSDNPLFIVNGFIRSGITSAYDGLRESDADAGDEDEFDDELTDEDEFDDDSDEEEIDDE